MLEVEYISLASCGYVRALISLGEVYPRQTGQPRRVFSMSLLNHVSEGKVYKANVNINPIDLYKL